MGDLAPLLDLGAPAIYGGVLIFVRLTTCLLMLPELGPGYMPMRARIAMAIAITIALDAGLGLVTVAVPEDPATLLLHLLRETLLGAALGLAVRLINASVQMAGDLVGLSMGLSLATFFDQSAGEMPLAMGRLFALVASLLFFSLGGHLVVVGALFEHLAQHPVGLTEIVLPSLPALALAAQHIVETAVLLAAPVVVVSLVLNVAMGFVMRVVPSMNLFNIGIGILLTGGFLALALEGDAMVALLGHELEALPEHMSTLAGGR
jgi:flagellar biosynthetic protein FliR